MDAGLFRYRISFTYFVKNADGYGGYTSTSGGTLETLWGAVTYENGEYVSENGKRSKQKQVQVIIRKKDYESLQIPVGYSGNSSLEHNDIQFSISDSYAQEYRVIDLYESDLNEYITIIGVSQ